MSQTSQYDRQDVQMAAIINIAVELLAARGPRAAAAFLEASSAKFAIIAKVLAEPSRRRQPLRQNVLPLPRPKVYFANLHYSANPAPYPSAHVRYAVL
jgi:hypothetical protein